MHSTGSGQIQQDFVVGENPEEVSLLSDFHSPLSIDWRSRLLISVFSLSTMTLFKQTYDVFHSATWLGWCEWGGGMMEDRTSIRQEWGFRPMCCYNTLAPCLPFSEISPSCFKNRSHFLHPNEGISLFASQVKYNCMSPISEVKLQRILES